MLWFLIVPVARYDIMLVYSVRKYMETTISVSVRSGAGCRYISGISGRLMPALYTQNLSYTEYVSFNNMLASDSKKRRRRPVMLLILCFGF